MNRMDYERATLQGIAARQAGKKADANPYQNKPTARVLADSWAQGWQAESQKIRGSK